MGKRVLQTFSQSTSMQKTFDFTHIKQGRQSRKAGTQSHRKTIKRSGTMSIPPFGNRAAMVIADSNILHFEHITGTKFMKCGNQSISVTWMAIMQKMTIDDGDFMMSYMFGVCIVNYNVARHLHFFV